MLAVGGGAAAAVLIAVGAAGVGAAAERLWVTDTIDAAGAAALVDLSSLVIGNAAALGLGVMIAATGLVLLRSQVEPRWAGVISVLVAIALISPYAWAALAATILWTPAASILIYRSASRAPSSEPTGIA